MLTATDSFIEYMAVRLGGIIPVHWCRQRPDDENAAMMRQDHLNVRFLGFFEDGSIERCLVSLDVLGSDERTVLGQLQDVRDLLMAEQVIPELDYEDPSFPLPTGRAVCWEAHTIRFLNVRTPRGQRYVHYNATFPLTYTRE